MQIEKKDNWIEFPNYFKNIIVDPKHEKDVDFLLQKIKVKPNTQSKIHYHKNQKEIFIVTKNQGYFVVDGKKIEAKEGQIIKILPNEKHTVGNNSADYFEFIAIKLKFNQEDTYTD